MPTTSDYLQSLQNDLSTIVTTLNLSEGTNFTDIKNKTLNGEITTGGASPSDYFSSGTGSSSDIKKLFKKIPAFTTTVTDCYQMFSGCTELVEIDMTTFDTTNMTSFRSLFNNCQKLETVTFGNYPTTNLGRIDSMFMDCSKLETINLSFIGEGYITYMNNAFDGCVKLKEINLSNFKTTAGISMNSNTQNMFRNCSLLEKLDMRSFDFTKITGTAFNNFFRNVPTGCLIIVADTTQKNYIQATWTTLTNVKTVSEL